MQASISSPTAIYLQTSNPFSILCHSFLFLSTVPRLAPTFSWHLHLSLVLSTSEIFLPVYSTQETQSHGICILFLFDPFHDCQFFILIWIPSPQEFIAHILDVLHAKPLIYFPYFSQEKILYLSPLLLYFYSIIWFSLFVSLPNTVPLCF